MIQKKKKKINAILWTIKIKLFVLMAKMERKLYDPLDKVLKKIQKKGITLNSKETECIVISKKE